MATNSPNLRIFGDKFDYFLCLMDIVAKASKVDAGKKVICFVEDDFFQKVGFDVDVPNVDFIKCGPEFNASSVPLSNDIAFAIYAIQHTSVGLPVAKYLMANNIRFTSAGGFAAGGFVYDDKVARNVIEQAYITQTLTGFAKFDPLAEEDFANLCQALFYTNHLPGDVVEVGCFRGSSGSIMLDYAKEKGLTPKTFYFFDVFAGFDYPEALSSLDTIWVNTHATEGVETISHRLQSKAFGNTVHVEKVNIITDKIPSSINGVCLCNIDVDLYEAVHSALFRFAPLMVTGGIMICEDAGHTPGLIGARVALDEFIQSDLGKKFTVVFQNSGQVFLIKHQ